MSYIDTNLLPGEKIIYKGKIHIFYVILLSIGAIISFLFFIVGLQVPPMWIFGFGMMIGFLYNILYHHLTEIIVTNKRVIYKTGIIARNVFELQLQKLESVKLNQSITERIIGAGTLVVSGTGGHNKPINYMSKPTEMRTAIYSLIEH